MSALLPEGVADLKDAPYTFVNALRAAMVVLSFDELESDERPPKRIWLDSDALNEWFDAVKRKRDAKYGTSDRPAIEDPVDNQAAKALITE